MPAVVLCAAQAAFILRFLCLPETMTGSMICHVIPPCGLSGGINMTYLLSEKRMRSNSRLRFSNVTVN